MSHDLIFDSQVLHPAEAATLRQATERAIETVSLKAPLEAHDRLRVADDVLRVARSGYTRTVAGDLDAGSLAEAAALRFRSRRSFV